MWNMVHYPQVQSQALCPKGQQGVQSYPYSQQWHFDPSFLFSDQRATLKGKDCCVCLSWPLAEYDFFFFFEKNTISGSARFIIMYANLYQ